MSKCTILDGKVRIYQRENTAKWHCAARIDGKNVRKSTGEKDLGSAKKVAEDWFFALRSGDDDPLSKGSKQSSATYSFKDAADKFIAEYDILTKGERHPRYVIDHQARVDNHLAPFFGHADVTAITSGMVQDYRTQRLTPREGKRLPSRSTLHHEIVTLRQIMKTALRHGWIDFLPDFSMPYRASGKVSHRAWFSHEDYKRLYEATRENIKISNGQRYEHAAKQLHDKILFMANTGLRPDETNNLEYRDVSIVEDKASGQTILEIEVRGKRGVGFCKSTQGAVFPFKRLLERNEPKPTDKVFPQDHKKLFNRILADLDLKFDRHGNRRTMYSLRHSYISFRLLEGADIYQIAKNCRTSVEMIEKHYAVHLKNLIDVEAINVRKR